MGNRIYYPIHQVGIKTNNEDNYTAIHGLQSVGVNTVFNNTPIPQLGYVSPHHTVEDSYTTSLTLNKLLDGCPLIFTLATADADEPTIFNRSVQRCNVGLSVFDDSLTSSTGTPVAICQYSGMYISSFQYTFDSQSNFQEQVSLVGDHKIWSNDAKIVNSVDVATAAGLSFDGVFDGTDSPSASCGIARRQDFLFDGVDGDTTILPLDILGIGADGQPTTNAHISKIVLSANINRESLFSLGSIVPYFRLPTFPIEATTEITVNSISGDAISATNSGILTDDTTCNYSGNLNDYVINIAINDGTRIGLGYQNKLMSVNYQGGNASAASYVTTSYTYKTHDMNPACILHQNDDKHSDFWADRIIWLLGVDYTDTSPENGVSALYWNNIGVPVDLLTLTSWPPADSELYKFNIQVDRTHESITGLLIEEQIDTLNSTGVYTTWTPVGSGTICSYGCTRILLNIYDYVVSSGAVSDLSTYQYRVKGLYDGTESNPTDPITLNIQY